MALCKLLLDRGADFNDNTGGTTALLAACEGDHPQIVQFLLEVGADVNSCDRFGWSLLQWTSKCGNKAVVRVLLENGANANDFNLRTKESSLEFETARSQQGII